MRHVFGSRDSQWQKKRKEEVSYGHMQCFNYIIMRFGVFPFNFDCKPISTAPDKYG